MDVLLKYFGCVVNSHIPSHDREKFDKKGEKNIFVGYNNESKGYRLFNPKTNKLVNSHVNKGQNDWQNTVSGFFIYFFLRAKKCKSKYTGSIQEKQSSKLQILTYSYWYFI